MNIKQIKSNLENIVETIAYGHSVIIYSINSIFVVICFAGSIWLLLHLVVNIGMVQRTTLFKNT